MSYTVNSNSGLEGGSVHTCRLFNMSYAGLSVSEIKQRFNHAYRLFKDAYETAKYNFKEGLASEKTFVIDAANAVIRLQIMKEIMDYVVSVKEAYPDLENEIYAENPGSRDYIIKYENEMDL